MADTGKVAEMDSRLQKVEMEFEGIKSSITDLVSEMKLSRGEQHENNKQLALNNQRMQQYLEATQKAEGKANKAHERIDEVKEDHGNRILVIEKAREIESSPIYRVGSILLSSSLAAGAVYAIGRMFP